MDWIQAHNAETAFKRHYPECDPHNIKCPECQKPMIVEGISTEVIVDPFDLRFQQYPLNKNMEISITAKCIGCVIEVFITKYKKLV